MNPDSDLLTYVLGGLKKIHKEVPQRLFVTYGRAVFKVEGDVNQRSTIRADVTLLGFKRLEGELLVSGDVLARSQTGQGCDAFERRSDHTITLYEMLS